MIQSAGQLGFGVMDDTDEVTTTRLTPSSFDAVSTLLVPLIAGDRRSFYNSHDHNPM